MVKERGGLVDFIPIFLVVDIGIFWVFLLRICIDANPSKSVEFGQAKSRRSISESVELSSSI